MRRVPGACLVLALLGSLPMTTTALDLGALWDFRDPVASERRLRAALDGARGDDALVLRTQIARSLGLRRDFDGARRELQALVPILEAGAGPEPRVRWQLEWGRSFVSATHPEGGITEADRAAARRAFARALELAREAGLDALAIDAVHMGGFLDPAPADQRRHAETALAIALGSTQPAARRWEASIRNNLGVALQGEGRHEEALAQFRLALTLREREAGAQAPATRVAAWMVAHSLRRLGRLEEALVMQQRLDHENEAAGTPDPHVLDELVHLHRALGQAEAARGAEARRRALPR